MAAAPDARALARAADDPASRVHLLTVATDDTKALRNLLRSAAGKGYRVHVLGLGSRWDGWGTKCKWYAAALEELPPAELAVCIDAYDAYARKPAAALARRYAALSARAGAAVIAGAEERYAGPAKSAGALGSAGSRRPYLCAGFVAGPAGALAAGWREALRLAPADDQLGWGRHARATRGAVALDDQGALAYNDLPARRKAPAPSDPCFVHCPAAGNDGFARLNRWGAMLAPGHEPHGARDVCEFIRRNAKPVIDSALGRLHGNTNAHANTSAPRAQAPRAQAPRAPVTLHQVWWQGWDRLPARLRPHSASVEATVAASGGRLRLVRWDGRSLSGLIARLPPAAEPIRRAFGACTSLIERCDIARLAVLWAWRGPSLYLDADVRATPARAGALVAALAALAAGGRPAAALRVGNPTAASIGEAAGVPFAHNSIVWAARGRLPVWVEIAQVSLRVRARAGAIGARADGAFRRPFVCATTGPAAMSWGGRGKIAAVDFPGLRHEFDGGWH